MSKSITKEIVISAPIERVFRCFTDQDELITWHGKEATIDPVPGGVYAVTFENGNTIQGVFLEVEPPNRIRYEASYMGVPTVVEVSFATIAQGTRVSLRQEFEPSQDTGPFSDGWDYFLARLSERVMAP